MLLIMKMNSTATLNNGEDCVTVCVIHEKFKIITHNVSY